MANDKKVKLNWTGNLDQTFKVEFKKNTASTWTLAISGLSAMTYTIDNLEGGTLYNFRVTAKCPSGGDSEPKDVSITTQADPVFIWIEDTFTCEQTTPFTLAKTVTGFSSPINVYWDDPSSKYAVVDIDDRNGNVYTFDPDSINSYADRTVISGIIDNILANDFDSENRKIWAVGDTTDGVKIIDLTNNNVTTIEYGNNGPFLRMICKIFGENVYCGSRVSTASANSFTIINRNTLQIASSIPASSIPDANTYLVVVPLLFSVGNEIWVACGQRVNGNIAIYSADFTTRTGLIDLPGVATIAGWGNGWCWQGHFYDEEKKKFYSYDVGSGKWFVIDTTTKQIIHEKSIANKQGKPYGSFGFLLNPLTGELYMSGGLLTQVGDPNAISKTYRINRDTQEIEYLFSDFQVSSMSLKPGTNEMWGTNAGAQYSSASVNPNWNIDGKLLKFVG